MSLLKKLRQHAQLEASIRQFFGYVERWRFVPFADRTTSYWMLSRNKLVTYDKPFARADIEAGRASSALVQSKELRREGFACVEVDTQTDGNMFLYILDEALECKNFELIELYEELWG